MNWPIDPLAQNLYTLGSRQQATMTFLFDFWGLPPDPGGDDSIPQWDGTQGAPGGNEIKLYTNVPLSKQATKEFDMASEIGRNEVTNLETLDAFFAHSAQPAQDGWYMQCTYVPDGSGASMLMWWALLGNPLAFDWRSATLRVIAKRVVDPPSGWIAANQPAFLRI